MCHPLSPEHSGGSGPCAKSLVCTRLQTNTAGERGEQEGSQEIISQYKHRHKRALWNNEQLCVSVCVCVMGKGSGFMCVCVMGRDRRCIGVCVYVYVTDCNIERDCMFMYKSEEERWRKGKVWREWCLLS